MSRFALLTLALFVGLFVQELSAQTPQINPGGIVNGASFAAGVTVAPGSIASVFGSNFGSSTAGVTLLMNGITAPLFAVSSQQINSQVPWELAGQSQASVTVTVGGQTSNSVTVALAPYGPGIFVANSSGQGAILIANTASVAAPEGVFAGSRRANPGEFISIFSTGLGTVTSQPATGVLASGDPPSTTIVTPAVTIGGVPAAAVFSGLAPGYFGLYQVNVQVPNNTLTGDFVPLSLSIGGSAGNKVTIAIASPPCQRGVPLPFAKIESMAIDSINPSNVYVGTDNNGIYKSCDGGKSWIAADSGVFGTFIRGMAIDPSNPRNVYAVTQFGFFKSANGGQMWISPNMSGLPGTSSFTSIVLDPSTPSTLYLGDSFYGVFKSVDGGNSWIISKFGLTNTAVLGLVLDPKNPTTLYALEQRGFFRSVNGGQNWTAAGTTGLPTSVNFNVLTVDPLNPNTLYCGTSSGVFKSVNGGQSWVAINSGLIAPSSGSGSGVPNIQTLAINPVDSNSIYAGTTGGSTVGGNGVFKSTNGGQTWTAVNSGLTTPNILVLAIDPTNPAIIYAGTDAGVFKSANGGQSWQPSASQ